MDDKLTLNKLSKKELIWMVKRVAQTASPFNSEYYIDRALGDLFTIRLEKRLDEADRISKLAHDKRMEYIDLLAPYDGKRIIDIPLDILKKADALLNEAQLLDKKWEKLAGI